MAANKNKHPEVSIPILPETDEQKPKKGIQNTEVEEKPTNYSSQCPEKFTFDKLRSKKDTRFGEPSIPLNSRTLEKLYPTNKDLDKSSSQKTTKEDKEEEKKKKDKPDEWEIYKRITAQLEAKKSWSLTIKLVIELLVFLLILACLICSLTVDSFKGKLLCGVEIWKWFALLMAIFSGMLVTKWVVHCIVFLIEWRFFLKKNVVYFTHGLQGNVVVFLWNIEVLVTWVVLFKDGYDTAPKSRKILDFITRTLASLLIGSSLWLAKTTLIKILASSFHLNRYFPKIQEAAFHQYVLHTLSGKPLDSVSREESFQEGIHKEKKAVDWEKLHQIKKEKTPYCFVKLLTDVVSNSGLMTMSKMLTQEVVEGEVKLDDDKITYEEEAIRTAVRIFCNVVGGDAKKALDEEKKNLDGFYIEKDDLYRFMIQEEVKLVFPLFETNEKKQIDWKAFTEWVKQVYKDRKSLQHALNDNKTAVDDLNSILNGVLVVTIIILWLLLTDVLTTKVLLFFASQILVAGFVFKNTCKAVFEAIIFVFVMHPFDVGDRCFIDGTMMLVEEMNILTTVFLKWDNEKLYYPNSVLATKTIGNFYRSPDQGDVVEFAIDYRTPLRKITDLENRIKQYVEQKPNLWHPEHAFIVSAIEDMNKIKIAVYFTHTINFQDFCKKSKRRTEFVLKLKEIFDELNVSYQLLPQEIHLTKTTQNYLV